jgi:hypothetical protein
MIIDVLKDAILSNIGPMKSAPKGWHKRNCMLCHTQGHGRDTRNRFGIQFNPQSIAMNCFNCGFSAGYTEGGELSKSLEFFLHQLNVDKKFIDQLKFEIYRQKNQLTSIRDGQDEQPEDKESKFKALFQKWKTMELPEDSLSISQWLDAGCDDHNFLDVANYAISRKLLDLDNFFWSPSKFHNLNQRLTIPYYYKNKVVGFTSRLCFDLPDKSIPKYFQQCPEDFVYNLDSQQGWARKYVLVAEGVLDAWAIDGISTLGEIGQSQIDIINRLQKQVIVIPDGDLKGGDLVDAAIENNWSVSFPTWLTRMGGMKDASAASEKYGRLLTTYSVISSAVTGKDKINVQWKIRQNERTRQRK